MARYGLELTEGGSGGAITWHCILERHGRPLPNDELFYVLREFYNEVQGDYHEYPPTLGKYPNTQNQAPQPTADCADVGIETSQTF